MDADTRPLTVAETETVQRQLRARAGLAWRFTILALGPASLFVVRTARHASRLGRSDEQLVAAAGLGITALVVWGVWRFGWRLVTEMRADLAGGQKQIVCGEITALDSQKNAYGETITHLTIQGVKLVSRAPALAAWKPGQRARVECLPRSRVVFGARLEEG